MKKNIRITLYLTILIMIIVLFLVFGTFFIRQAQSAIYNEKVNYLKEISKKSADIIYEQINGNLTTIEAIATFIGSQEIFDTDHCLPILIEESKDNSFKRMGIILPDGTALTTDGYKYDFSDRDYFKRAIKGNTVVSDTLIDKVDSREINVFSTPIYHKNQIVGVVFATRDQEQFSKAMSIQSFNGNGYSYVIKADGNAIVKPSNKNSITKFQNLFDEVKNRDITIEDIKKIETDLQNGKSGLIGIFHCGEEKQVSYTKININDWYILSVVPTNAISQQTNRLIYELIIMAFVTVLIIILISFMIIFGYQKNKNHLEYIAYTDKVTGYSNWKKFSKDAKNILNSNKSDKYAMIIFDVKQFKVINDMFGHEKGDVVLKTIAQILDRNIDKSETFSRISADNFSILMKYYDNETIISRLESLSKDIQNIIKDYIIEIRAGIYPIVEENLNIDMLSDRANVARNMLKERNDTFYYFFKEENRLSILRNKEIENSMENALANNEFEIYLQPKYLLENEKIIGTEALVRWNKKNSELIFPNEFIPLFEENGFIKKLDLYMFEKVCALIDKWNKNPAQFVVLPVSVNISRTSLSNKNLPQLLLKIADKYGVNPNLIEIELTESALYLDIDNMIEFMHRIKQAGFSLSIDDFGSGYSSLSTLKELPADYLKIDKSFLDKATNDKKGEEIINSIVGMSKVLGLSTVAEGVETEQQKNFLKKIDCTIAQGYYYSKPLPIEKIEQLLTQNSGK